MQNVFAVRWWLWPILLVFVFCYLRDSAATGAPIPVELARPVPEFPVVPPADWLNSGPLTLEKLEGRVLLIHFWTFDCWNCYRSFPWLNSLEELYARDDLVMVGVHSPEFEHERDRDRLERKIREYGISHPVLMDNGFVYWKAMHNRYWPAYYLVDRRGRVRGKFAGETHAGDRQAQAIKTLVDQLVRE